LDTIFGSSFKSWEDEVIQKVKWSFRRRPDYFVGYNRRVEIGGLNYAGISSENKRQDRSMYNLK
jgi:hypothetical protein